MPWASIARFAKIIRLECRQPTDSLKGPAEDKRMKKWLPGLFALPLTVVAGVACGGIAYKGDAPGASPRQALLIANAGYVDDDVPLRHPITDARALADELRRAGFDAVVGTDLSKQAMQTAIADFATRIK